MSSVEEVVDAFKNFLEIKHPSHYQTFLQRLTSKPESARAEAVLFSILRVKSLAPLVSEDPSSGGIDFLGHKNGESVFFLEVTSLGASTAADVSGIPETLPESPSPTWFKTLTKRLRRRASGKTVQLSGKDLPCILAITTEHSAGEALLGTRAAEDVLTGDPKIAIPIGDGESQPSLITELEESVVFRKNPSGDGIQTCRRNIAAILLVQIYLQECRTVGILHPDPLKPFSIDLLPSVPFVRLRNWPPQDNKLKAEWVIANPEAARFFHLPVELTDDELKHL